MYPHDHRHPHRFFWFLGGGILFAIAGALLFGVIVMFLWNWLMTDLFRLPAITYLQGAGLVLLSHLLFKPAFGGPWKRHGHGDWKQYVREKYQATSEDEAAAPAGGQ